MPGFKATLKEFSRGRLHSGSKTGPLVHSRKQALAIAYSERSKGSKGALHEAKQRLRRGH